MQQHVLGRASHGATQRLWSWGEGGEGIEGRREGVGRVEGLDGAEELVSDTLPSSLVFKRFSFFPL